MFEEDIKNADWIKNEHIRNVISHTLPRSFDNLINDEDPKNQFEFYNFTDECDRESARAVLMGRNLRKYIEISKGQPMIEVDQSSLVNPLVESKDDLRNAVQAAAKTSFVKSENIKQKTDSLSFRTLSKSFVGDKNETKNNQKTKKLIEVKDEIATAVFLISLMVQMKIEQDPAEDLMFSMPTNILSKGENVGKLQIGMSFEMDSEENRLISDNPSVKL